MSSTSAQIWYRLHFKVRMYEASGEQFQRFVGELYQLSGQGFQSIAPWGPWGDGGNDGWIPDQGHYFQIYGPRPTTEWKPLAAVRKAVDDFSSLRDKWLDVRQYSFVLNDRFSGIPAPVARAVQDLRLAHGLDAATVVSSGDLERHFMTLDEELREVIVGGSPLDCPSFVDQRAIGELLSYLADRPTVQIAFLHGVPPGFDEKLSFNGLDGYIAHALRTYSYQTSSVSAFLTARDAGLQQAIAGELRKIYEDSKTRFPETDVDAPSIRYVWIVDQLIPEPMREHPHSMKAYREAAQIIMATYFETCDVYDHPQPPAAP